MTIVGTDFTRSGTDIAALDANNNPVYVREMNAGDDDQIAVNLEHELDSEEVLDADDLETELWQLANVQETEDEDASDLLVGAPTLSGTIVSQRVASLTKGRWYRLYIYFGPAGNHRSVTIPIRCN